MPETPIAAQAVEDVEIVRLHIERLKLGPEKNTPPVKEGVDELESRYLGNTKETDLVYDVADTS